jgi:hypothetical protein
MDFLDAHIALQHLEKLNKVNARKHSAISIPLIRQRFRVTGENRDFELIAREF